MAEHITLGFVGDFPPTHAHSRSDAEINQLRATISGLNQQVDFSTANFECTILPDDIEGRPKMALQMKHCSVFERINFDIFCLADNHILDNKKEGLLFTQQFLEINTWKGVTDLLMSRSILKWFWNFLKRSEYAMRRYRL